MDSVIEGGPDEVESFLEVEVFRVVEVLRDFRSRSVGILDEE